MHDDNFNLMCFPQKVNGSPPYGFEDSFLVAESLLFKSLLFYYSYINGGFVFSPG